MLFAAAALRAQTLNVENFNNPGAAGRIISGTTWVNNVTRNPDTIVVGGSATDVNGWGASGQSLNATGMTVLTIFARRDVGNVASSLVVSFYDSNLRSHQIAVPTSEFAEGSITAVRRSIVPWPSGFNPAQITDWDIGGGTPPPGTSPFRMTFDHLALSPTDTLTAPTITVQPADRVAGIGTGTTLTVTATGTPTLRYQWKRGTPAAPISGATNATLELANLALADADTYQVDVTNDVGTTPSRVATVTVLDVRATHALAAASAAGYAPGKTVTITNTITFAGPAPTGLGWLATLPAGWSFASDAGTAPQTKPAVNTTSLLEWTWTGVLPTSPVTFTYTLNVPADATGAQSITAQVRFTQSGAAPGLILAKNDPLIVPAAILPHTADTNGDFRIDLFELTRVIELYNVRFSTTRTGAYAVDATNLEDGFAGAPTRSGSTAVTLTRYHAADTNRDARISLVELTRVIELYNFRVGTTRTGDYRVLANTEDGFAPGPSS